jgi:dihydroxyacetone kinase-like predicted kinase
VRSGDVIGIINKQIIACEKDVITAAAKAIDRLLSNGTHTALTVFTGKDSNKENDKAITEYLSTVYSDCEVFLFPGEQEIYSYIFVAE